jgi:hypothetical protein
MKSDFRPTFVQSSTASSIARRPVIIVVLRDLDVDDRHRARESVIQHEFATIRDTLKAEVSAGRADVLSRLVCVLRLMYIIL